MNDFSRQLDEIEQMATQRIDALARDPMQPKPVRRAAREALRSRAEAEYENAADQVKHSTAKLDTLTSALEQALARTKGQPFGGALHASVENLKSLRARLNGLLTTTGIRPS